MSHVFIFRLTRNFPTRKVGGWEFPKTSLLMERPFIGLAESQSSKKIKLFQLLLFLYIIYKMSKNINASITASTPHLNGKKYILRICLCKVAL